MTTNSTARPVLDLARLNPRELWLWLRGWEAGYLEGAHDERADVEADRRAAAACGADVARRVAGVPPRDVLEERRGRPARAQAVRQDWHRRDQLVEALGGWGTPR
ncbi:hypothetical protein [Kineococcus rubinsiae]|uniref:hypothetical protein n=1 Tax=Kineococcus rubinsiae TaxID=2609562 RepID=UPI00142F77C9|nr:hypothetical protein [Kineococcus rubinsiae]NIZ91574.1 hypothetical protein [Kineococcus rubinsiae]